MKPARERRRRHLRVPVTSEEAEQIVAQARAAHLPIAAYLRDVGLGYQPRAAVDYDRVQDLLRINGDLGRLGGLLKLWLSDDRKLAAYPRGQVLSAVRSALAAIEATQEQMRDCARAALRQGSK